MKSTLQYFIETRHKLRVADVEEFEDQIKKIDDVIMSHAKLNAPMRPATAKKGIGEQTGERYDSAWEYAYHLYQTKIKCVPCERNHSEWLPYVDENGKQRKWFFDFVCEGRKVEIKGRFNPTDLCKQQAHPEVLFIDGIAMKPVLKEVNKVFPDWKSTYSAIP